jgi:hypothetical protein
LFRTTTHPAKQSLDGAPSKVQGSDCCIVGGEDFCPLQLEALGWKRTLPASLAMQNANVLTSKTLRNENKSGVPQVSASQRAKTDRH